MANRSLPDLPYAASAVDGDIFHINQDGVDKQLSGFSLAEHVLRTSAFARVSIDVHTSYVLTLANPKDVDITANAAATNYSITLPAAAAALAPTRVTISRKGVAAGTITIIIPGHTSVVLSAEEDFAIVSCQKTGASAYSWIVLSRTQTPQEVLAKWQASDPFAPYSVAKRTIPGSDDDVLTVLNTQVGKPHSILEVMAPAGSTAEATLSLHAVASDVDWVFDYSLHNYSGSMKGVFVLSVFNKDTKTQMQWVFKRRPTGSSGYGTTKDYYMMQLSEDGELEINVAGTAGPTPDWKRVLTEANRADFATASQGAKADAAQPAATAINTGNIGSQSVSYAGSAGNADTVDGQHASAFATAAQGGKADSALSIWQGTGGSDYGSQSVLIGDAWVIPAGHFIVTETSTGATFILDIHDGNTWVNGNEQFCGGVIWGDGARTRLRCVSVASGYYGYLAYRHYA